MNIRPREIADATHQLTHETKEKLQLGDRPRYNEPAASYLPQISASRAIQEAESKTKTGCFTITGIQIASLPCSTVQEEIWTRPTPPSPIRRQWGTNLGSRNFTFGTSKRPTIWGKFAEIEEEGMELSLREGEVFGIAIGERAFK
ncbi:hypothetical protein GW17_00033599, partial [Ensete ventricosum]